MLEVVVVVIVSPMLLRRFKVTVAQYGTCVFSVSLWHVFITMIVFVIACLDVDETLS